MCRSARPVTVVPMLDFLSSRADPSRTRSFSRAARTTAWCLLVALIAALASERVYWYWAGISVASMTELAVFYGVASAAALFVMALIPVRTMKQMVLIGALFGLIVEGVLTPVTYEDGPLPVLFLMFVGWHGLLAFLGFFFFVRRWALDGRRGRLSWASAAAGVWWGVWALSSAVVDRETAEQAALDGGSSEVLVPFDFAVYAAQVGVVLLVAHLVLGRLWPDRGWRPSRRSIIGMTVLTSAVAALLVVIAVPWAPLKFAALSGFLWWAIRRPSIVGDSDVDGVLDRLAGRVTVARLWPVLALPTFASITYAAMWQFRSSSAMDAVFWTMIAVQAIAGAGAVGWALLPARGASAKVVSEPF